jgi:predicted MFS family arabinose efflux permease
MYRLTHSELMLGLTGLFNNLPMLLLGSYGGLVADRYDRRRIVMLCQSLYILQAASLATLTFTGLIRPWHIYSLGILFGVVQAFEVPARQAMMLDMSSREDIISTMSVNSMIFNFARVIGPTMAGLAISAFGEGWCFVFNGISFVAVVTSLSLMHFDRIAPGRSKDNQSSDLWNYLAANIQPRSLLILTASLNIGFSGFLVLNPFFAEDIFHQGPRGLGFLMASMGAGAVLGTYLLASRTDTTQMPRVSMLSAIALGIAIFVYSLSPHFLFSMLVMSFTGAFFMRQVVANNSSIQTIVPEQLRGRVASVHAMAVFGMSPIGSLFIGACARQANVRFAAALAGAICLGGGLWFLRQTRRFTASAVLLLILCGLPAPAADANLLKRVDEYLKEASQLTGFSIKRKVPAAFLSAKDLEKYLDGKMKTEVDKKKLRAEELVLERFGFAPPGFRLGETTLALLNEQAAAFYDFKARKLFVLDHVASGLGPELLIHELGHALADQHFGLRKFLSAAKGDDASLARMSVMEGQAMWLMGEHAARAAGTSLNQSPELVRRLSAPDPDDKSEYPVLAKAPLYLRESLLFPYAAGFRFQAALCAQDAATCMSRPFLRPPTSSAQILHPELYFAQRDPERVDTLPPPATQSWRQLADGDLGELDLDLLLRTHNVSAPGVAEAWRGGAYRLLEGKKTQNVLLLHTSQFQDESAAQGWFDAYSKVLAAKWKSFEIVEKSPAMLRGRGDYGPFRLTRVGRAVHAAEGLPLN